MAPVPLPLTTPLTRPKTTKKKNEGKKLQKKRLVLATGNLFVLPLFTQKNNWISKLLNGKGAFHSCEIDVDA